MDLMEALRASVEQAKKSRATQKKAPAKTERARRKAS
jgi:hypothetical protein